MVGRPEDPNLRLGRNLLRTRYLFYLSQRLDPDSCQLGMPSALMPCAIFGASSGEALLPKSETGRRSLPATPLIHCDYGKWSRHHWVARELQFQDSGLGRMDKGAAMML